MSGLQLKTQIETKAPEPPPVPATQEAVPPPPQPTTSAEGAANPAPSSAPPPAPPSPPPAPPPLPRASSTSRSLAGPIALSVVLVLLFGGVLGGGIYLLQQKRGEVDSSSFTEFFARDGSNYMSNIPELAASVVESAPEEEDQEPVLDEATMYRAAYDVEWPILVLSGMVAGSTPEQTSAILNGNLVATRERIEGAVLIEIRNDGVVLEFDRTRKFIRVGEST